MPGPNLEEMDWSSLGLIAAEAVADRNEGEPLDAAAYEHVARKVVDAFMEDVRDLGFAFIATTHDAQPSFPWVAVKWLEEAMAKAQASKCTFAVSLTKHGFLIQGEGRRPLRDGSQVRDERSLHVKDIMAGEEAGLGNLLLRAIETMEERMENTLAADLRHRAAGIE